MSVPTLMVFALAFLACGDVHAAPAVKEQDCPVIYDDYDYIVVGGGSAGSVVASRLSEDVSIRVLVLEAGDKPPAVADVPLRTGEALANVSWTFQSEPQGNCCMAFSKQRVPLLMGKALGGTSNINSMIFTRGNKQDYDRIQQQGVEGWSYEDVLPFYIKMENYQRLHRREDDNYHGSCGPQVVSAPIYRTPLSEAFLDAGWELGYHQTDVNAQYQTGFMASPTNIKDGVRWGAYNAYMAPAMTRPNLRVITNARALKVTFDGNKATGVVFGRSRSICSVQAKKEIILSAGALRSPQLLLLSGIGNKTELEKMKVPVVHDLPGVGKNLQDHVYVLGVVFFLNQSVALNKTRYITKEYIDLWEKTKTGPLTSNNGVEGIAFFDRQQNADPKEKDYPATEITMYSENGILSTMFSKEYENSFNMEQGKDAVSFVPVLLRPKSVGEVLLKSDNPLDDPAVDPRYLSHPDDAAVMLEVLKTALSIGQSKSFRKYGAELIKFNSIPGCDGHKKDSDEFWTCYLRHFSITGWHFVGTCRMAPSTDPMAVVDSQLRVVGVDGLRIADTSIMPHSPAGHTYAIAVMIGERAADFIRNPK